MNRSVWMGSVLAVGVIAGLVASVRLPEAHAQRTKAVEVAYDYHVVTINFNPGENLNDAKRAERYEKLLNVEARQGWEPVTSLLSRTEVQTIGGGVTSRETTSFVAFRRPKK
jgi:hypothetical protein